LSDQPLRVRPGTVSDAQVAAVLHAETITEGFLPTLGLPFLALLYRRIAIEPTTFLVVADDASPGGNRHPAADQPQPTVLGMAAGAEEVRTLYRSFLLHDGLRALAVAGPGLRGSWRRMAETLRYPAAEGAGAGVSLPPAELLSVAVAAQARGRGVGRALVQATLAEFGRRRTPSVRVVAGSENRAALRLYRSTGFRPARRISVHAGTSSEALVWP